MSHAWSGSREHASFLVQFVIFRLHRAFRINHCCQRYFDGLGLGSGFIWLRPFLLSPSDVSLSVQGSICFLSLGEFTCLPSCFIV
jgi:hypothetical protein